MSNPVNVCPQCGSRIPAGAIDCAACWSRGTPLDSPLPVPSQLPSAGSRFVSGIPVPAAIAGVVGVPLLCLGMVLWLLLGSSDEELSATRVAQPTAGTPAPQPPPKKEKPPPIAVGVWYAKRDYGGGPLETWLTIQSIEDRLTGSLRLVNTPEIPFQKFNVDGARVTFTLLAPVDGELVRAEGDCQVSHDTMKGIVTIYSGEKPEVHDFLARRE